MALAGRREQDGVAALRRLADAEAIGFMAADVNTPPPPRASTPGVVRIGLHRAGPAPDPPPDAFDILFSTMEAAAPWVRLPPDEFDRALGQLAAAIARQPVASAVAAQVIRTAARLDVEEGLLVESLGYSTLLASEAFRAWRLEHPARRRAEADPARILVERRDDGLHIRFTRPRARNAVDARMRDALVEALAFAAEDPEGGPVILSGEGAAFCAGGDLDEFGQADDPGRAHAIRTLRSAVGALHRIRDRVTARVQGACIGAGVEVAAAAGRVVAAPDAVFRLPEVAMGLVPGAGGTVSIPRRIGRQRACYLALSGVAVDAAMALDWGLVDAVEDRV